MADFNPNELVTLLSAGTSGCRGTGASNPQIKIFGGSVTHPANPRLPPRCSAFPLSPGMVLGWIWGKKGRSGGGRGQGELWVIPQLCKQPGSGEGRGDRRGPRRRGLPSPWAWQISGNSGWERGRRGDGRFGVTPSPYLPQAAPGDRGGAGGEGWTAGGCRRDACPGAFQLAPGVLGMGMMGPGAGTAWIFAPAPVGPAGSSPGGSRRQRGALRPGARGQHFTQENFTSAGPKGTFSLPKREA